MNIAPLKIKENRKNNTFCPANLLQNSNPTILGL